MKMRRLGLSVLTLILILGLLSGAPAFAATPGAADEPGAEDHIHTEAPDVADGSEAGDHMHGEEPAQRYGQSQDDEPTGDGRQSDGEESTGDGDEPTDSRSRLKHTDDRQAEDTVPQSAEDSVGRQAEEDPEKSEPVAEDGQQLKVIDLTPNAKSSILMDVDTGTVIFEKNVHERMPPASITKIMTMLLVMEAIDQKKISLDEMVTASDRAASMGGSQIFLEAGEQMSVRDLLKGVAMASGNDASVALAEKIAGSEEMFVEMMNARAKELGMNNTHFVNSNGLPAPDHYSTAHDIAVMSRELLKYESITEYTGKYQDYLRTETENPFWLVNTNKLVRFYTGVDGLKTGYTSEAKFCLSATAKKDNLRVIAVVLGEPNTKTRNAEVASLFDFAFSQYTNMPIFKTGDEIGTFTIEKGQTKNMTLTAKHPYSVLLRKGEGTDNIRHELVIEEKLKAPIAYGQKIGKIVVYRGDEKLTEFTIESPQDIGKAGWWTLFKRSAGSLFFVGD